MRFCDLQEAAGDDWSAMAFLHKVGLVNPAAACPNCGGGQIKRQMNFPLQEKGKTALENGKESSSVFSKRGRVLSVDLSHHMVLLEDGSSTNLHKGSSLLLVPLRDAAWVHLQVGGLQGGQVGSICHWGPQDTQKQKREKQHVFL